MINNKCRRVKIVATIGPVTRSKEVLEKMILAGANVFRLNFSHSTYDDHLESFNNIKFVSQKLKTPVAILADMQGPKLRVGKFKEGKVLLEVGQTFILDSNAEEGDVNRVSLPHPEIFEALKKGDTLLVDDGKIRLEVQEFGTNFAKTKVIVGGYISNAKGVNFPSGILKLSPLTEKDLQDLEYALNLGVDYIGLSFVQLASDIEQAKKIIAGRAKIVSKIEKPSALENIEAIITASDVIMVARGDLGVEIPTEQVPVYQKKIIAECRRQAKPVIVATQMLESMTTTPLPTRAEASDVANALYDGADAVMLSAESTVGAYPVEAVSTMNKIARCVEQDPFYWDHMETSYKYILSKHEDKTGNKSNNTVGTAISRAAKQISENLDIEAIVTFSRTGTTTGRVSHQKPHVRILSATDNPALYTQMCINWGVTPILIDKVSSISEMSELAIKWIRENNWAKPGAKILLVAGGPMGVRYSTNDLRIVEV